MDYNIDELLSRQPIKNYTFLHIEGITLCILEIYEFIIVGKSHYKDTAEADYYALNDAIGQLEEWALYYINDNKQLHDINYILDLLAKNLTEKEDYCVFIIGLEESYKRMLHGLIASYMDYRSYEESYWILHNGSRVVFPKEGADVRDYAGFKIDALFICFHIPKGTRISSIEVLRSQLYSTTYKPLYIEQFDIKDV